MRDTKIVSAFPATGKSYFSKHSGLVVLDSDSSRYGWITAPDGAKVRNRDFPANYIKHIQANMGKADYILVSSHEAVRQALRAAGLEYLLVYPDRALRADYVRRCERRSDNGFPIQTMLDNWDAWIDSCEAEHGTHAIKLWEGQYLSDVLTRLDQLVPAGDRLVFMAPYTPKNLVFTIPAHWPANWKPAKSTRPSKL